MEISTKNNNSTLQMQHVLILVQHILTDFNDHFAHEDEHHFLKLLRMDRSVIMSQWRPNFKQERMHACTEWDFQQMVFQHWVTAMNKPEDLTEKWVNQNRSCCSLKGLRVWWCSANQRTSASHSHTGSGATSAQQQPASCQRGALTGQGPLLR